MEQTRFSKTTRKNIKDMAYALITGAAKGIGKAIACELVSKGYDLLLIDLDADGLTHTAAALASEHQASVHTLTADLSAPETVYRIKEWAVAFESELQVLVNNAAFGLNGAFEKLSLTEQLQIIDVNVKSVVALCHLFIPVLRQQKKAYILNIGSNAGYQPVPYLNIYAASKAFIVSFTRSLRYELRGSNVHVSCVSPGSTDTSFVDRAGMSSAIRKTAGRYNMSAAEVAKIAVRALFNKRKERITGVQTKLGVFLSWLAPKSWSEKFGADIFSK